MSQIASLLRHCFLNLKRLFHLLITLAFMFLTLVGASQTYLAWEVYQNAPDTGSLEFKIYGGLTVLLAILCLYSYVKARNVR